MLGTDFLNETEESLKTSVRCQQIFLKVLSFWSKLLYNTSFMFVPLDLYGPGFHSINVLHDI